MGSILSVTLFYVKINSITQCLKPGVDCLFMLIIFKFATDHATDHSTARWRDFLLFNLLKLLLRVLFHGVYLTGGYPLYSVYTYLKYVIFVLGCR